MGKWLKFLIPSSNVRRKDKRRSWTEWRLREARVEKFFHKKKTLHSKKCTRNSLETLWRIRKIRKTPWKSHFSQELSSGRNKAYLRSHLRWLKSHSNFQSLHRDSPKSTDWILFFFFFPRRRNSIYCGGGGRKIIVMRDNLTVSILPETKVCLLRSFSILQPLLPHMLHI